MSKQDLATDLRFDQICLRFEEKLKQNLSPSIEAELDGHSDCDHELLFAELLRLELWYAEKNHDVLKVEDYRKRFPTHLPMVEACFRAVGQEQSRRPLSINPVVDLTQLQNASESSENPAIDPIALPYDFGRYRITKSLGTGAMGNVYLAEDQELKRQVALKVPRIVGDNDAELKSRLRIEAQAAAKISHPNLCSVYDIGTIDGTFYITMAYIEGQPLSSLLKAGRKLNTLQSVKLVRKIANALEQAHQKGIVHRDLKPSNIMVDPQGEPIVVDFGLARTEFNVLARLTAPGAIVGTPAYASPEQIQGKSDIDRRTDGFSLGMILYELLTGQIPYDLSKPHTLLQQIAEDDPIPPSQLESSISQELDAVCQKALAKHPANRYQTMQEFDESLAAVEQNLPIIDNRKPDWFRPTAAASKRDVSQPYKNTISNAGTGTVPTASPTMVFATRLSSLRRRMGIYARRAIPMLRNLAAFALMIGLVWIGMQIQSYIMTNRASDSARHSGPPTSGENPSVTIQPGSINVVVNGQSSNAAESPPDQPPESESEEIDESKMRFDGELPMLGIQLPIPKGGWAKYTGVITAVANKPISFTIYFRAVDLKQEENGHRFQTIEIDVKTNGNEYQEQASLLVDVDEFTQFGKFVVKSGWILAPKENVLVEFDAEIDAISHGFKLQGLSPPLRERLAVQDVLAILFNADVATSSPVFGKLHNILRNERELKNLPLKVEEPRETRTDFWRISTIDSSLGADGQELPIQYSPIEICLDSAKVPFNWGKVTIEYRQLNRLVFSATMKRERGNTSGAEAEFSPPTWTPVDPNPIDYKDYAFLNLPDEPGSWCSYEVKLLVPKRLGSTLRIDRVEVKVLEPEVIDEKRYRWIEVRSQIGGDFSPRKIVESVKLLIDEELYQQDRTFRILKGGQALTIGNQEPLYARFEERTDRMADYYGDKLPINRLPIRNVLSLMFSAELEPHVLEFSIRRHISNALIDGRFKRHFIENKSRQISANADDDDLICTLVRPGRSVSIIKKGELPPTTLDYKIFVSQDKQGFPFRWVNLEVDLLEESEQLPSPRVFGGYLVLREYGTDAKSEMPDLDDILWNDPEEQAHRDYEAKLIGSAKLFIRKGKTPEAIKVYEKIRDFNPDTLTAKSYQQEIDKLKKNK